MKSLYKLASFRGGMLMMLLLLSASCEDFVEVGIPDSQLAGEIVFESTGTADAAMADIYYRLRTGVLVTGSSKGLSVLLGQYSDELISHNAGNTEHQFSQNSLVANNTAVRAFWNDSYNLVYACNAVLEGVAASAAIPPPDKDRLIGEAQFVRAYIHFHLMQLFGEIPFVTETDYRVNSTIGKLPVSELYPLLVLDLFTAASLLPESYADPERVRPVKALVAALMARIQLYRGNWLSAADEAEAVINNADYVWVDSLDDVFLKTSPGTLWQLMPPNSGMPTLEGQAFILNNTPANRSLNPVLAAAFETGDQRRVKWVGTFTNASGTWYYPFKYKKRTSQETSAEYSILFRLDEMYLIRAEARARYGDVDGAREDLNKIRLRAGLPETTAVTQEEVIDAVLRERRFELFTEHGHRWFDLRRTGRLDAVLSTKPGWDLTDALWPLPEQELLLNPNLLPQNAGY